MVVAPPPPPPGLIVYDSISLDGQRTFVSRERADGRARVVVLRGGWNPVWSPDGSEIAAFARGGIAVVTRAGRVVRRVRSNGTRLSWSPDGSRFGYVVEGCIDTAGHEDAGCGTLWVVRTDGSGRRRLSPKDAINLANAFGRVYAWSPDGRRIAYLGVTGLVVVDVVTGRRHLIGPTSLIPACPDWSPDGRRILYARGQSLVTIAADGSDRRIVRGGAGAFLAQWSPDGRRIAYVRNVGPVGAQTWMAFVSDPDGSHRVRAGVSPDYQTLQWSPDGNWLMVGGGGDDRVELLPANGDGPPRLVPGGENTDWGS